MTDSAISTDIAESGVMPTMPSSPSEDLRCALCNQLTHPSRRSGTQPMQCDCSCEALSGVPRHAGSAWRAGFEEREDGRAKAQIRG